MSFFSRLFGADKPLLLAKLAAGAVIVDVRPPYQYDQGKIPGSLNIPIEQIQKNAAYLKSLRKPVVFCGTGSDSSAATRILHDHGLKEAYNGGSWERVLRLVRSL